MSELIDRSIIKRVVFKHTKLNPKQFYDQELVDGIADAVEELFDCHARHAWGSSITESIAFQHEQKLTTAQAREKLELARLCRKRIQL